jgi:hypothetical protein
MYIQLVRQKYGLLVNEVPFFCSLQDHALVELCRGFVSISVSPSEIIVEEGM